VLETARLRLRELGPEDLDFVAGMLADAEVMRFYPQCFTRAESLHWIERQRVRYRRDGHGLWLLVDRASGTPVGQAGLTLQDVNGTTIPEIGYLLARPYWGRGYATEAARGIRDHAFGARGLARVVSLIRPENARSRAVASRIGMREAGEAPHAGFLHLVYECTPADVG
jgi:RimJ/RimL family protein N-acetyltransferase